MQKVCPAPQNLWSNELRPKKFSIGRFQGPLRLRIPEILDRPSQLKVLEARGAQFFESLKQTTDVAGHPRLSGVEPVGVDGNAHHALF